MRIVAVVVGVLCAVATAALVVVVRTGSVSSVLHPAGATASASASASTSAARPTPADSRSPAAQHQVTQIGIVTNNLYDFQKVTSAYPSLTDNYLWWGSPFPSATVLANHRLGAETLIVLEPEKVSLPGIADGREDTYLKKFAAAERKLGLPILLSFGPEANGDWYPWGAHHITPQLYVDMWRQVHDVIMSNGGTKIAWLWQVNTPWPQSEAMSLLWPGSKYVNEVGIDGQLKASGATFSSVFDESLSQVRDITSDPIMISEVSVRAGPDAAKGITSLFDGACSEDLTGVIVFDIHAEWEFDHNSTAVAAFRKGATAGCGA